MSRKIIWALFDDGAGSWNHCDYDKEKWEIHSIGINDNPDWENYHKIDLRLSNPNLIKELKQLPKPDIIVASPPCESWSIANNQQRIFREADGNIVKFFTEENNKHNNETFKPQLRRNYYKLWGTCLVGMDTSLATNYIIETFKPEHFVIENPQSSKIWEFLNSFGGGGNKNSD